jgi:hypothetical protein
MTEMVTSGSMSGEGKRSDGLLGEGDTERCRSHLAPPALHATALLFDSTGQDPAQHARGDQVIDLGIDVLDARIHQHDRRRL